MQPCPVIYVTITVITNNGGRQSATRGELTTNEPTLIY